MTTILVVDDDERIRRAVRLVLKKILGHTVLEACDGREAIATLRANSVDMVLSDVQMPRMGGVEMHGEIQSELAERGIRFGFMSGGMKSSESSYLREQGLPLLDKPFDPQELAAFITRLLAG